MKFSDKFGWKLDSFIEVAGNVVVVLGWFLIIIGFMTLFTGNPPSGLEVMLAISIFLACIFIGILLILAGTIISSKNRGPRFWLKIRLEHKLQIRPTLKAAREVRQAGIRWSDTYTASILSWCIHGNSDQKVQPTSNGARIALEAYNRYAAQ